MAGKRVFAAIDISDEARARVGAYITHLRSDFRHLRVGWEKPEKLHITLRFEANIDDGQLDELTSKASKVAGETQPFNVAVVGPGAFQKGRGSNVLWLGLDAGDAQPDPLQTIEARLAEDRNSRGFKPHLTVARLRERQNSQDLIKRHLEGTFKKVEFMAAGITIYESTLTPAGSIYKVRSRHSFRIT